MNLIICSKLNRRHIKHLLLKTHKPVISTLAIVALCIPAIIIINKVLKNDEKQLSNESKASPAPLVLNENKITPGVNNNISTYASYSIDGTIYESITAGSQYWARSITNGNPSSWVTGSLQSAWEGTSSNNPSYPRPPASGINTQSFYTKNGAIYESVTAGNRYWARDNSSGTFGPWWTNTLESAWGNTTSNDPNFPMPPLNSIKSQALHYLNGVIYESVTAGDRYWARDNSSGTFGPWWTNTLESAWGNTTSNDPNFPRPPLINITAHSFYIKGNIRYEVVVGNSRVWERSKPIDQPNSTNWTTNTLSDKFSSTESIYLSNGYISFTLTKNNPLLTNIMLDETGQANYTEKVADGWIRYYNNGKIENINNTELDFEILQNTELVKKVAISNIIVEKSNQTPYAKENWVVEINSQYSQLKISRSITNLASTAYEIFGELFFNIAANVVEDQNSGSLAHAGLAASAVDNIEYPDQDYRIEGQRYDGYYVFYSDIAIAGLVNKGGYFQDSQRTTFKATPNRNFLIYSPNNLKSAVNSGLKRYEQTNIFGPSLSILGTDPENKNTDDTDHNNAPFNNLAEKPWINQVYSLQQNFSHEIYLKAGSFGEEANTVLGENNIKKTYSAFDPQKENFLFVTGVLGNLRDIAFSGNYMWRSNINAGGSQAISGGNYQGSWRKGIEPGLLVAENNILLLQQAKNLIKMQVKEQLDDGRIWKFYFTEERNLTPNRYMHIHPMPTYIERLYYYLQKTGDINFLSEEINRRVPEGQQYVDKPSRTPLEAAEQAASWIESNMINQAGNVSQLPWIPAGFDTYPDLCINSGNHTYTVVMIYSAFDKLAEIETLAGRVTQATYYQEIANAIKQEVNSSYLQNDFASGLWKDNGNGTGNLIAWRANTPNICAGHTEPVAEPVRESPESFANFTAILEGLIDDPDKINKILNYFWQKKDIYYFYKESPENQFCTGSAPDFVPTTFSELGPTIHSEEDVAYWYCHQQSPPWNGSNPVTWGKIKYVDPWYGLVDIQARLLNQNPQAYEIYQDFIDKMYYGPISNQPVKYPFYETYTAPSNAIPYLYGGRIWEASIWFNLVYNTHYGINLNSNKVDISPHPLKFIENDYVKNVNWQEKIFNVTYHSANVNDGLDTITVEYTNGSGQLPLKVIFPNGEYFEVSLTPGTNRTFNKGQGQPPQQNPPDQNPPDGENRNPPTGGLDNSNPFIISKVFTTSTTYLGNFGGQGKADNICQKKAQAAGLTGKYKAWLSTTSSPAKDRIPDAKYVKATDTSITIANNKNDLLDGTINTPLEYDEYGNKITDEGVWTGTGMRGNYKSGSCMNWTNGTSNVYGRSGLANKTQTNWTDTVNAQCNSKQHLYCFQVSN